MTVSEPVFVAGLAAIAIGYVAVIVAFFYRTGRCSK